MPDNQKTQPTPPGPTSERAPFRIAAVQMVSGSDVAGNLGRAGELIAEAAAQGARLVALPEYFGILGMKDTDKVAARERDGDGPIQRFLADTARTHGLWLLGGSVPLESQTTGKVYNSSLLYDDQGHRVARYDKIHLFGLDLGTEKFSEARTIVPGGEVKVVDSPFGRLGLSICYDVRFPELYRAMGVVDIIFVPSAFTATTGRAHWEPLLRARAIENLAWVIAPAQGGLHPNGRATHGHSMIIDPWGAIVAERAGDPGVVIAEIDPTFQARMRASLPALEHRTLAGA
jgi:predicted amidohydrolase